MPHGFCLSVAMTGWFTEDPVWSKIKEGASTPSWTHPMSRHSHLTKAVQKDPRQSSCGAQHEAAEKEEKRNDKPGLSPTSTSPLFYSITRRLPHIQCVVNMLAIVITELTRRWLGV